MTDLLHNPNDARISNGQRVRSLNPGYLFGIADCVTCTDVMTIAYHRRDNEYRVVEPTRAGVPQQARQQEFASVLEVRVSGNSMRLLDPRDIEFIDTTSSTITAI